MSAPRGLSPEEQAAWARLAQSVTPLVGKQRPSEKSVPGAGKAPAQKPAAHPKVPIKARSQRALTPERTPPTPSPPAPTSRAFNSQLDASWNRKLKSGQIAPDYTLDLHGHTLDGAYGRIMGGIDQARSMGARVVLIIAGRERPVDPADRQHKRGAIRAKLLDWLAASHHADHIAAVRRAHIRHGGEGALYLVLKRPR